MAVTARKMGFGAVSETGLARAAAIAALLIVALAVQSTLLAQVTLLGVIPELVFVVVVSLAFVEGERVGVVAGFFGGLLQDLLLFQSIVGLKPFVYVLVGYGVGSFRQYTQGSTSVWTPVFIVAVASAVAEVSYAALAIIMGQPWVGLAFTGKVAGLVVLYNTLLTPFMFPLVRKVADRFRPERVHRW